MAPDRYACPLCLTIDYERRSAQFKAFDEGALAARTLTVEHVPPRSFGGKPLLLICKECNDWSGTHLDSHARRREIPRDAFAGKLKTKVSMVIGGHRLAGSFTVTDQQFRFDVTKKPAHRVEATPAVMQVLSGPPDSGRTITLSFDRDAFDDERACTSWLRAAYLAIFAVAGYRTLPGKEMEIVRRQIREPKAGHIPTFLVDTRLEEQWTNRSLVHVRQPEWQRCRGIKVGRYVVCLPLPGDHGLYNRLTAARRDGTIGLQGRADMWEWPTEPSFGLPHSDSTIVT